MRRVLLAMICGFSLCSASAQEFGTAPLGRAREAGMGHAPLPRPTYHGFAAGGSAGVTLSLGWVKVDWDLGPADGSESLFAPQASIFFKATEQFDVNLSLFVVSADDRDDALGRTEADLTRLAVGSRYWVNTRTRAVPYFGAGIGYYFLDGKTEKTREDDVVVSASSSVKDRPGAFLEGGVAFQISDQLMMTAGMSYDFLLGSAKATINGKGESFDVSAFAINLGLAWIF